MRLGLPLMLTVEDVPDCWDCSDLIENTVLTYFASR